MTKPRMTIDLSQKDSYTQMMQKHLPLVKKIAHHLLGRLPPSVLIEDLTQAGLIGLIEAYGHFDDTKGASFETYAGIRVRGAMLDEIRKGDWAPRSVHRNARAIASAIQIVEHQNGRQARDTEIAEQLGLPLVEYHQMLQDSCGVQVCSFEDFNATHDYGDLPENNRKHNVPLENTHKTRFKEALAQKIRELPEREALVLTLYYDEEMNLKEIGKILGVSESRVSQMHAQATLRLKSQLENWKEL